MKVHKKTYLDDGRTLAQIREQYEIEKELANKLRHAPRDQRKGLYTAVYDELFRRIPHHLQLTAKINSEGQAKIIHRQMNLLKRFCLPQTVYMEIGPGDCLLACEVAKYVKKVFAVDVSNEITRTQVTPPNFELIFSDGCSIPVPQNSVNVAYSNQLMEHLHPDDACEQLQNIYRSLAKGGMYICITPHKFTGPHDISKYFDEVSTGLHLKEYTLRELLNIFRKAGFSKFKIVASAKGINLTLPTFPVRLLEQILSILSYGLRKKISGWVVFRIFFRGLILVALKK